MNEILIAREQRFNKIKTFGFEKTGIIVMKANIPGNNKNIPEAMIINNIFKKIIEKTIKINQTYFYESEDGPYYLFIVPKDAIIKTKLIDIEDNHNMGRLIDLDYYIEERSISRQDLGKKPRKCLICGDIAFVCGRSMVHSYQELITSIKTKIEDYLTKSLRYIIYKSIIRELRIEDKFGLVTPSSNGSHPDMNYQLMQSTARLLVSSFVEMFFIGYHCENLDEAYQQGKKCGLHAEQLMFSHTNGVNAYKGLIFLLGLACISTGNALKKQQDFSEIYQNIKIMTKDVFNEPKYETYGEYLYETQNIKGARGEAYQGFPIVSQIVEELNPLTKQCVHLALIKIIALSDDTVMIKRAKKKYQYFKSLIMSINNYDLEMIKKITNECIDNNISCGGAADVLITALYIRELKNKFW